MDGDTIRDMAEATSASHEPASLFHYTTAAGLLGILGTRTLWATDVRFLNDTQESLYGEPLIVEAIRAAPIPDIGDPEWAQQIASEMARTFADYQGYVLDEFASRETAVFVACFCEAGDLLSQWRGYGSDHGYAVEVRTDMLRSALDGLSAYAPATGLQQVRYGLDAARAVADRARMTVSEFNLNHPGVKAHYKALELAAMVATVKNPAFGEEREWRLFAAFEQFQLGPTTDIADGLLTRFRATAMAIVPYVELSLPLEAIRPIRVGPGRSSDAREAGGRAVLKSIGSEASVLRSEVPLRG